MILEITQEDIDSGVGGSAWRCPVANALWRSGVTILAVGISEFLIRKDPFVLRCKITHRLSEFILRFDSGKKVLPGRFLVRLPKY